jgi:hypothetical protein
MIPRTISEYHQLWNGYRSKLCICEWAKRKRKVSKKTKPTVFNKTVNNRINYKLKEKINY